MGSELEKRKINPPKRPRCISPTAPTSTPTPTPSPTRTPTLTPIPTVKGLPRFKDTPNSSGIPQYVEKAKNFAIALAQQDGCIGNFLIPVIPTRAELFE